MEGSAGGRSAQRPTVWIVISAVAVLAAIGLGIWGFTTKSDLDDAEATVEQQKQRLAGEEQAAEQTEAQEVAFGRRAERAYRRVRRRLIAARREEGDLRGQIKKEAGELEQSREQVSSAQSADERLEAQLKAAKQGTQLAAACARGTLDAINEFFNAADPQAGADRAMKKLEDLQSDCESAVR